MILDDLDECIRGLTKDHNPNVDLPPEAILWPDPDREWTAVVTLLRERMSVLTLAEYEPSELAGPAIWIRCALASEADVQLKGTPVVYLPGVSRDALRGGDGTPAELAPLVGLQFRGKWFVNPQGQAWTATAFFRNSDRGLGLNVADGSKARAALRSALPKVMRMDLGALLGRVLDASFFNELMAPDVTRSMLEWISGGSGGDPAADTAGAIAFREKAIEKFGIDPATSTPISAAALLGKREEAWGEAWRRYAEAPERYPGIPDRLRQARPDELVPPVEGSWPQDSEDAEADLGRALASLETKTAEGARAAILDLWSQHQRRMGWIWTEQLGMAPFVEALQYLADLAEATRAPVAGETVEAVADSYANAGWKADDALLKALAQVADAKNRGIVAAAAAALYSPWAEQGAAALQAAIGPNANSGSYAASVPIDPAVGTCFLFVDGLRFDLGRRVAERLEGLGVKSVLTPGLAALPTVTPTAKLALTPNESGRLAAGGGFSAAKAEGSASATLAVMHALLEESGLSVLKDGEIGDPGSGPAWTEIGKIDSRGHSEGLGVVDFIDGEVDAIVNRIRALLEAGWDRIELVTDHGWVLSPQMLTKTDLPVAAVDVRKGRCARLKPGAPAEVPTVPWFWDPEVRVAVAPGMSCFENGKFYEHGGVSPQECVVPRVVAERGQAGPPTGMGEITEVKWLNLLCRIRFSGVPVGSSVDIRALAGEESTSIAQEARETSSEGKASLLVPDDELEGEPAYVVITGPDGYVLAQRRVVIGSNG